MSVPSTDEDLKKTHKYTIDFPEDLWQRLAQEVGYGNIKDFIIRNIRQSLENRLIMGVVLCGGAGTRFRPLTITTPAVMLPIGYKPVLDFPLSLLRKHNIRDVILSVGYLSDHISKYYGSGENLGINISYVAETVPLDTGGAVKNARELLGSRRFLVLNGDVITNARIDNLIAEHQENVEKGAIATILLSERHDDVSEFGHCIYNPSSRKITSFVEKPSPPAPVGKGYVNGGIYIFESLVFDEYIPGDVISLENQVFPFMAEEEVLYGHVQEDIYWKDAGRPKDYEEAWADYINGRLEF